MTTQTNDKGSEVVDILKDRWYPRTQYKAPVEIDGHTWQLIITKTMEIGFYKKVIKENDMDPFWKVFEWDYEPYFTVPSIGDNLLPPELSAVTVMRRIFERLIGMIQQYRLHFFTSDRDQDEKRAFSKVCFNTIFRSCTASGTTRW